jgi:hypothetical protein
MLPNDVDKPVGRAKEDQLHHHVVFRGEVPEDIHITCREDDGIELLALQRYT